MNLLEATMKALQGKLEEKPNKDNAKINAKLLNPRANEKELRKKGYSITGDAGVTSVKRADRKDDFREIDVFDDGTVMTVSDKKINDKPIKNKEAFDAKSFLDTKREKPYEAPNKVSRFKMNKDTIEQADMEIADAEIQKAQNPEDAKILDKNVIEPWQKMKTKAGEENAKMLGRKYTEKKSLHEGEAHIRTNEEKINDTLNDTDFMNALGVTAEDVIKQVKISKEQFDEISDYVANYKGTFGELYKELGGWNLGYDDVEKIDDNLFDCYYKSLLITVCVDDGKLSVQPTDVYVYASDISAEDMDEMFELDFDKPIDFSKLKVTENRKVTEDVDVDLGEDFYEKICRAYVDTANLEWVTTNPENNNSVVHGYFVDDNQANEYKDKVTPDNFKDIIAGDGTAETIEGNDYYEYDTWEDFYEEYVKDEIAYDINDIGVYSDGSTDGDIWDFYISEEDLTKLGLWDEDMKSEFLDENKKITEAEQYYDLYITYNDNSKGYIRTSAKGAGNMVAIDIPRIKRIDVDNGGINHDLDENKKVTEDYNGNALDRTIVIENIYGNTLMSFKVSPDGKLYEMENCEIADEENAYIRIQQEEDWGEHTDLEDMYNDRKKQESKTEYQDLVSNINDDWKKEKQQVGNFNRKHSVGLKLRLTVYKDDNIVQTFYDINKFNKWANNNDLSGCKAVLEDGTFNLDDEFEVDDTRITYTFK